MKVSLNTIKHYIDFELPPVAELVERINMQLGGVEEVIDLAEKYKDVVVVKVLSAEKHSDADRLSVCVIDDGGVVGDVERDTDGHVQVVCGAPNVREGIFAAWLPPKSTVPASYGTNEPFVLDAREIRGVKSNGMLAAADELALGSDHTGIIEIHESDLPKSKVQNLKSGEKFAELFGLDDTIIDIENKMFTHRPDCFGQLGVAREIAGILGHNFTSPGWYAGNIQESRFKSQEESLPFQVENNAAGKVPRFMAVALRNVEVKPSPLWLQIELVRLGSKPINNIVDATNYVMLLTAQPTHAYDYDKLRGATLGVRMAGAGETASLLNGKTYELTADDIVIVDGEGVVGLGGVMGGGNSEVSETTKNIVLEVATFDMYAIRKTSMRHGLFTDAVTRFNKGQSSFQQPHVLPFLMDLLLSVASGKQATKVFDLPETGANYYLDNDIHLDYPIVTTPAFISDRLGMKISSDECSALLENVELRVHQNTEDDTLSVHLPFWRKDISVPEDIVEEVGRLYGFEKVPRMLPERSITPATKNSTFKLKKAIRESLSRAGANEVLTYSFVHERVLKNAEQDSEEAFQLGNALSPDLQYYRLSVLPSLLEKVHPNIKSGHDEFMLFEIGKGHRKSAIDEDGLPVERGLVDAVYASKKPREGAAYYRIKKILTVLAADLGFTLKFKPVLAATDDPVMAPFDPKRSATVESRSGEVLGIVGELKTAVVRNFKLPDYSAALSLDLEGLKKAGANAGSTYRPLSRFPKVTQDISLTVPTETAYEDVFWTAWGALEAAQAGEYDTKLEPLSIYQSEDDSAHKTVTLRVSTASYEKTLTDKDVNQLMDNVADVAQKRLGAERI